MNGRVALVTGATSGIGKITAREIARTGARTLVVARDPARGAATAREIGEATGNEPEVLVADLSAQDDIRRLAREVRARAPRLDLLVNNAGAIFAERAVSRDGVEMTFALNHLAYFLLTLELLPTLEGGVDVRVVNVSSVAHEVGRIDFDDLQGERRYGMWKAYAQSKLANVLFTRELSRRVASRGVSVNAVHPGAVASGFGRNGEGIFARLVAVGAPFLASPERGARTSIHVATSPDVRGVSGRYFARGRERSPAAAGRDDAVASRLWSVSEALTSPQTRLPAP